MAKRWPAVVSLFASATALVPAVSASDAGASTAVGPDQSFVGLVNGHATDATVDVVCPGPAATGRTGHPTSGQTLGVQSPPPAAATSGFTGTKARSIAAVFVSKVAVASQVSAVSFTQYGTEPLPTTLLLPCSGTGTVVFSARPTSKSARTSRVMVSFANLAASPAPPSVRLRASSRTVTVTQSDDGQTYKMRRGDRLDVELSATQGFDWTEPTSPATKVLKRLSGTSGNDATATFVAIASGRATVSAVENASCYPLCEVASRAFEVGISVTG
jgi:hypothetical protein